MSRPWSLVPRSSSASSHRPRHRQEEGTWRRAAAGVIPLALTAVAAVVVLEGAGQAGSSADAPRTSVQVAPVDWRRPGNWPGRPNGRPQPSRTTAPIQPSDPAQPATAQPTTTQPSDPAQPATGQPTSTAPEGATAPAQPASSDLSGMESQVVDMTNTERQNAGCQPLTANAALTTAARRHAQAESDNQAQGHQFAGEADLATRYAAAGYTGGSVWGENAAGAPGGQWFVDAHSVMYGGTVTQGNTSYTSVGWMQDQGHKDNILNCAFKDIGVGVVRDGNGALWWSQEFVG